MVYRDSDILEYTTDSIIRFLDDHFDSLYNLEVVIFTYHNDKRFMTKLTEKLLDCGCNVTLCNYNKEAMNLRSNIAFADVAICNYTENEIPLSYPDEGTIILDITGKSLSDLFIEDAEVNPRYSVYTSKTED